MRSWSWTGVAGLVSFDEGPGTTSARGVAPVKSDSFSALARATEFPRRQHLEPLMGMILVVVLKPFVELPPGPRGHPGRSLDTRSTASSSSRRPRPSRSTPASTTAWLHTCSPQARPKARVSLAVYCGPLSDSHCTGRGVFVPPKRASTLIAIRSRMASPSRCPGRATQAMASRSQQSRAKATWTRSPFQHRISKASLHQRRSLARVTTFPRWGRVGLLAYAGS